MFLVKHFPDNYVHWVNLRRTLFLSYVYTVLPHDCMIEWIHQSSYRYALGELLESERDYITDLTELLDKLEEEDDTLFLNKHDICTELRDLAEFHTR